MNAPLAPASDVTQIGQYAIDGTSIKSTVTGVVWQICNTHKEALAVASDWARVERVRQRGCTLVCGNQPGQSGCIKCWKAEQNRLALSMVPDELRLA